MIPVNSIFSTRIVTNFYYTATKRCLFAQCSHRISSNQTDQNAIRYQQSRFNHNAATANKETSTIHDSPQLVTSYFDQFPNYCQMITDAKNRARRSILIDNCGVKYIDLENDFQNVEHVYSIVKETKKGLTRLTLIEFRTEEDAELVAKQARHNEGLLPVPLKVFQYVGDHRPKLEHQNLPFPVTHTKLTYKRGITPLPDSYCNLVANNMMSLVALKMRFITLVNFERILCSGMFEEFELMPFGSSVIDTGCDSGDLDLLLTRKEDHSQIIFDTLEEPRKIYKTGPTNNLAHLDKSLYSVAGDTRGFRATMKWFDHVLKDYMPLSEGVTFIPHAQVPIIKFTSRITSIECDLSFNLRLDNRGLYDTNYSGILMSQIMYSLCRQNNLFVAVVIYLRAYAKLTGIKSKPGEGFTNFQLLSLIIFYLQRITINQSSRGRQISFEEIKNTQQKPLVPSFMRLLNTKLYPYDVMNLDDDELNQIVPEIVAGFFRYFSKFDFSTKSMNLYNACVEDKKDNSPIYVNNPLDRRRNICHNINRKSFEHFLDQLRLAISDSKQDNPLILIRKLLSKSNLLEQRNTRKVPSTSVYTSNGTRTVVKTEGIARDVCR